MRSTKIVATVGPASREPEMLERLIRAGVDVARLNFAHGTPDQHAETAGWIRDAAERVGREVAILGDIPGPKLRLGPVAGGVADLDLGSRVVLTPGDSEGTAERLSVAWQGLAEIVQEGDVCYLADGTVRLRVAEVSDGEVVTRVEVVDSADGIMIARGDLGIELPIEEVPLVQKRLLAIAGRRAKPTITATQMLESMVHSSRPTRAEVADVANAIFDGTDAVMLSQETAVGNHAVAAVEMMASIAEATERELPYGRWLAERGPQANNQYHAIAFGAVGGVYQLGLRALVSPTNTGTTARLISSYRPKAPVLALSPDRSVVRRCQLLWGVLAQLHVEPMETLELIETCADAAVDAGLASPGDQIGITAGLPAGKSGGTNLFKVHTVE
jgi:pyruvate kinase